MIMIIFLESNEECFQISTHVDVEKDSPSRMPWMLAPKRSPVKVTTHHLSEILYQWKVQDVTWKRRLQNLKHVCKRTNLLIVFFSTTRVEKSRNWIIFPNLLRLKKNFRLSSSAPTGWVSSQPGLTETNCPSSRQAMKKSAYQDWFQRNKPLTAPTQHRNRFGLPRRFSNTLIKWVIEWLCDQFWGRIHVLFNSCSNQIVQKLPWIFCSKSFETAQLS